MDEFLRAFRFTVELHRSVAFVLGDPTPGDASKAGEPLGNGAFQECSGLELEMDIKDHLEGGRNSGIVRRAGRVKLRPLVLKRGMFAAGEDRSVNTDLWVWLEDVASGVLPIRRMDGLVQVHDPRSNDIVMASWTFLRGLPLKISGPTLNAQTGEIAIEELQIAPEELRIDRKPAAARSSV